MTEHTCAISVEDFNGKYVKIFFKNSSTCEGIAMEWTNNHVVLLCENSDNILYIYNPKENIVMVKVLVKSEEQNHQEHYPTPEQHYTRPCVNEPLVEPELPEVTNYESDQGLRLKKIADLKKEQVNILKEKFNKRVKTFSPTQAPIGHYGSPSFKK